MSYEQLEHSSISINCHNNSTCLGQYCTVHNRSDHHMRGWSQFWRPDRSIMMRVCTHGIGHPDPDEYRIVQGLDEGIHGCDGCCNDNKDLFENIASFLDKEED